MKGLQKLLLFYHTGLLSLCEHTVWRDDGQSLERSWKYWHRKTESAELNIQIDRPSDTWQARQGASTPHQRPYRLRGYDAV